MEVNFNGWLARRIGANKRRPSAKSEGLWPNLNASSNPVALTRGISIRISVPSTGIVVCHNSMSSAIRARKVDYTAEKDIVGLDDGADNGVSFVDRTLRSQKVLPPFQWSHVLSEIQWISFTVLTITPILAFYGLWNVPLDMRTLAWSIAYYFITGLGITAGYHRLWSHRSYNASRFLEYALMCMGSGAVEGSIHWWSRGHRSHHRYTDTDLDPYGAHTGLLWAHVGWMIVKPRRKPGPVDTSDLRKNPVVMFQHRFYIPMILFWGLIFPTLVAGLGWGDWKGGFFFAGVARLVFVHHSTFCINSLAHYLGDATFDNKHSPRDNIITALCTVGEGYHNFHHEFPMDFRNAVKWYQYDPTKWFIWSMYKIGLAYNLKTFPENEINKGRLVMQLRAAHDEAKKLKLSTPVSELPILSWDDFVLEAKTKPLVVVHGFIHDMSTFMDQHPGGRNYIAAYIGKDASVAFQGGVYEHSNAAHNLLSMMRVGVLSGGMEIASRKQNHVSSATPLLWGDSNNMTSSESDEPLTPKQDWIEEPTKRVRSDAATYIPPGEAYGVIEHRSLNENVKMKGTAFGKIM